MDARELELLGMYWELDMDIQPVDVSNVVIPEGGF
jgi:hypothetical protein